MGKTPEALAKSVFVEKLHARGYEVLLLGQPLDEIFVQNLRIWKYVIYISTFRPCLIHCTGNFPSKTSLSRV